MCFLTLPKNCLNEYQGYCDELGNFQCMSIPDHKYRCVKRELKCDSVADCFQLFQCKDSICKPTANCYDNEHCNIILPMFGFDLQNVRKVHCRTYAISITKFNFSNFKSAYTIALIVGVCVAVILSCFIL